MTNTTEESRNWFSSGGENYARYRPHYPPELAEYLSSLAPNTQNALDVGCGTGQLTRQLAEHFDAVKGIDPSVSQLGNAVAHHRIDYACSPAETLPEQPLTYSLITAAQAAHWFKLDAFYQEVRRVAVPQGILALISYGVMQLDDDLNDRFRQFYYEEIGPFWPAERQLVDNGYRDIPFPFDEIAAPPLNIHLEWLLDALLGYISTWSAVASAREAGREEMLRRFYDDIATLWGTPTTCRPVRWPINMRIGRVEK
ncbi:class I SAM-dependent methyltransferase [Pectobacterium brasiliense]|uniref:class I SAM-dependent methyltransferase n=1 Tax=Pectobacterium brasiliense TaxID=180957 RepID=UPI002A82712E|nr:class I SAM-dependent methyltransferase [Pectobacterium brasiliense]MDY4333022.1 class I SAM-dependent methyltransferase [Pectobacterium brasiliense]